MKSQTTLPTVVGIFLIIAFPGFLVAQSTLTGGAVNIGANNLLLNGSRSMMVGDSNHNYDPMSYMGIYGICSLYVGVQNKGATDRSLLVGSYNTTTYDEYTDGYPIESFVIGSFNWMDGDYSAIVGRNNSLSRMYLGEPGSFEWRKPKYSMIIGRGLFGWHDNCLIAGKFNKTFSDRFVPPSGPQPIFVLGNGTAQNRSNALAVFDNGDVIIPKRQGDILMGEFGD